MSSIPKVIHYCWFGRGELPKMAQKCIKSWKKYLPDYKIVEWNEDNFDIGSVTYVKEAYETGKYAFVSDYVRLYVLYNFGGLYMDTDVEVLKPLDYFLEQDAFSGFEDEQFVAAGIMGCKRGSKLFKEFMDYYTDKSFINIDGSYNQTTIVKIITDICCKHDLKLNNKLQNINEFTVFPKTFFYPLSYNTLGKDFSANTYTIHHYTGSWLSNKQRKDIRKTRLYNKRKLFLSQFVSERTANIILNFKWILFNKVKKFLGVTN